MYKGTFDAALQKYGKNMNVEISSKSELQTFTPNDLKIIFADNSGFITGLESLILFEKVKEASKSTKNLVTGKGLYDYLIASIEPAVDKSIEKVAEKPKQKQIEKEPKSIIGKIEQSTGECIPTIFRKIPKPIKMLPKHLIEYIKVYYKAPA